MTIGYEYRPGSLYLNITNRCSNDCTFCVRQYPEFSLAGFDMRLEREPTVEQVLDDIARQQAVRGGRFDEVVFCGFGEPTLRLDLVHEVGCTLRAQGVNVRLNTNGQAALIVRGDPFPTLADAVDVVSVSLNAPDADHYRRLCRPRFGAEAHPAVVAFARRCTEHFDQVVLTVVGFVLDDDALQRCQAIADELGAEFRVR